MGKDPFKGATSSLSYVKATDEAADYAERINEAMKAAKDNSGPKQSTLLQSPEAVAERLSQASLNVRSVAKDTLSVVGGAVVVDQVLNK